MITKEEKELFDNECNAACIVLMNPINDGSMLAITRKENFHDIGLPGGKVDVGSESIVDAAVRECFEETGLLVEASSLQLVYCAKGRTNISATFLATKIVGGRLSQESKEGMPLWVNPQMLLKDTCTYKHYNLIIVKRLIENGIIK